VLLWYLKENVKNFKGTYLISFNLIVVLTAKMAYIIKFFQEFSSMCNRFRGTLQTFNDRFGENNNIIVRCPTLQVSLTFCQYVDIFQSIKEPTITFMYNLSTSSCFDFSERQSLRLANSRRGICQVTRKLYGATMTGFRVKFENEQTHLVCNEASKTD